MGESRKKLKMFLSAIKGRKLLASCCVGFLASTVDKSQEEKVKGKNVLIVQEFLEVFPEDLPSLPLNREIDFEIELALGTKVLKGRIGPRGVLSLRGEA